MSPFRQLTHRLRSLKKWEKILYITFTAQLINVIGFSSIFPFLPLYVDSLGSRWGLSIELLAGLVFSSQAFTMMIAAPIWGALADRYGRKLMMVRAMFGGAVLVLWMGFVGSAEMLIFVRALQGLVTGTISAANALIAASVPRDKIGFGLGLNQVALWGGVSFGPLLGGIIADTSGYRTTFILTAVLLLVGGILTIVGVEENFEPVTDDKGEELRVARAIGSRACAHKMSITITCVQKCEASVCPDRRFGHRCRGLSDLSQGGSHRRPHRKKHQDRT